MTKSYLRLPDGERFDQPMANSLSLLENVIILCGHYKGGGGGGGGCGLESQGASCKPRKYQ